MLVSLNWLKKFTNLPDDNEALIVKIGAQVAEVESVVNLAEKYSGVVVAEIVEAGAHPDADKLGLYQVNDGNQTVQVVAGDKTLNVGDKVACIAPGVTVPVTWGTDEPFVIENRPLRGQDSNGMLASAKELDWGDSHAGVLKLDTDKPAGTTLAEAYELDDLIIEIENKTLTHRPDCFGMIGFAREVAGVNDIAFQTPDWFKNANNLQNSENRLPLSVEIEVADVCSRYVGLVMDNVEIKQSPLILQSYLSRVGVRPINNIVDITNYLMVETGQPLHAFDYDKTAARSSDDAKIVVRYPKNEEKLKLLDGREIQPHEKAVLICTDQEAIAVGGAMGGADTEVDENTTRIIIESANFDLYNLRRTSMAHGIFSEAVTRFIRGQSPEQCLAVAERAAQMVGDLSGGEQASEVVDVYPSKQEKIELETPASFVNARLGAEYSAEEMAKTLNNVELATSVEGDTLKVDVPFWRRDLHIDEDVVEEVGRLIGYDNLPASLPARDLRPAQLSAKQQLIINTRKIMAEAGNNEVLTYNFVAEKDLQRSALDVNLAFKLRNSISPKLQVLRTALLPSLLDKIHPNIKLGYQEFGLFEINKSHRNNNIEDDLPVEEHSLAYVFAADPRVRSEEKNGAPYYQSLHTLNYLLDKLQIEWTAVVSLDDVEDDWIDARKTTYQTGRAAALVSDKGVVGIIGEPSSSVKNNYKLPAYASGFEINIDKLVELRSISSVYAPQLKYPGTQKDVTFVVDSKVSARDMLESIAANVVAIEDMQNSVAIVDIFQKDESTKNLTYRIELRHKERTLTADEANEITDSVAKTVETQFKAVRV